MNILHFTMLSIVLSGSSSSKKKEKTTDPLDLARELGKKHSFTIVTNDYNSDFKCLKDLAPALNANVYFYCKATDPNDTSRCQTRYHVPHEWHQLKRENNGREGESYIEYILTEQPSTDFTLFLQSDCEMKDADEKNPHGQTMEVLFQKISGCVDYYNTDSKVKFCTLSFIEDSNNKKDWSAQEVKEEAVQANQKFQFPTHEEVDASRFKLSFRGQFAVTKEGLQAVKQKYKTELEWTQVELQKENNPKIGHWLERYWTFIFANAQGESAKEKHVK